jgi:DNA-binding XRE family transcriptional regulator
MSTLSSVAEINDLGHTIREHRIELGWTQAELSQRADVPQADISRIENGQLDVRWSTAHRLAVALNVNNVPKRSLANGGRGRAQPKATRKVWAPSGPVVKINK